MARIYRHPENLRYLEDTTLTQVLLYHNLNNTPGSKPAIIDGVSGKTVFTYDSFRTSVRRVARHLVHEVGVQPGEVVSILSTNKLYYPVGVHGVLAAGAVVSALNPMYEPQELAHALRLSKPAHIIVEKALLSKLAKALSLSSSPRRLRGRAPPRVHVWDAEEPTTNTTITTTKEKKALHQTQGRLLLPPGGGAAAAVEPEVFRIEHVIEHGPADFEPAALPPGAAARTALAFVCFSSGTSGLVKGVRLSHGNVVANLFQQAQGLRGMFAPDVVLTLVVPFFHILGLAGFCCQFISQGAPIVVFKRFELGPLIQAVRRHRITHINIVPPIALEILRNPLTPTGDWSSVRCLMNAAAPLDQRQSDKVCALLGCVVTQWYGMTEASPSIASQREDEGHVEGTIGRLLPGMELRILNEDGQDSRFGEFVLRGPNIMLGYVDGIAGGAGPTDSPLTPDGFLRTGDIGYADEQGYLYIVDRAKEMIKVKGQQVAPAELEALLMTHPQVKDAAVCGVYNTDGTSEIPVAYITTDLRGPQAQRALKEGLLKHVNGQVARYKHITGGIHVLPAIPRNPSGKILRRLLPARQAAAAAAAATGGGGGSHLASSSAAATQHRSSKL